MNPVWGFRILNAKEVISLSEFKVGDRVEVVKRHGDAKIGMEGTVIIEFGCEEAPECIGVEFDEEVNMVTDVIREKIGYGYYIEPTCLKLTRNRPKTTKEETMSISINTTVAKVFKDVETALLVTKHLGREYEEGNHRAYLDLKLNEKAVLVEAERLEKEAQED